MPRLSMIAALAGSIGILTASLGAADIKKPEAQESGMTDRLPAVGSAVPDLEIYSETGDPFRTSLFKGRYTVIVFGCLT